MGISWIGSTNSNTHACTAQCERQPVQYMSGVTHFHVDGRALASDFCVGEPKPATANLKQSALASWPPPPLVSCRPSIVSEFVSSNWFETAPQSFAEAQEREGVRCMGSTKCMKFVRPLSLPSRCKKWRSVSSQNISSAHSVRLDAADPWPLMMTDRTFRGKLSRA